MPMAYASLREVTEAGGWRHMAETIVGGTGLSPLLASHFETYWIEAGHHIREQVAEDLLLRSML